MESDEKIQGILKWLGDYKSKITKDKELSNAMYTFSQLGQLTEIEDCSPEQAWQIWAIVEKCRTSGFPDELRM